MNIFSVFGALLRNLRKLSNIGANKKGKRIEEKQKI
jgi:hypothetical protein